MIDDGIAGIGDPCVEGVGACQADGEIICDGANASVRCDAEPGAPEDEVCDGVDNDCNNEIDDGIGLGDGCTMGVPA